jgi:hypothetical protein
MTATSSLPRTAKNPLPEAMQFVRSSKSLTSMIPSLVVTGLGSLLLAGLVAWVGAGHHFFGRWMETWLTAWPIAFPIVYLIEHLSLAAAKPATSKPAGMALMDIEAASTGDAVKNDLKVRRKRIRTFEVA